MKKFASVKLPRARCSSVIRFAWSSPAPVQTNSQGNRLELELRRYFASSDQGNYGQNGVSPVNMNARKYNHPPSLLDHLHYPRVQETAYEVSTSISALAVYESHYVLILLHVVDTYRSMLSSDPYTRKVKFRTALTVFHGPEFTRIETTTTSTN